MTTAPNVAVVGCGIHAHSVLLPALTLSGARVTAVCDPDSDRLRSAAARTGAAAFERLADLLSSGRADAAIVASPPATHASIVRELVAANMPTFVEKPAGTDSAELAELREIVHTGRPTVQVGFMRRFAPAYRLLRQLTRRLPVPLALQLRLSVGPTGATAGPFVKDVAIHQIDLCRFLLGDILEVTGFSAAQGDNGVTLEAVLSCRRGIASLHLSGAGTWGVPSELVWLEAGGEALAVDNVIHLVRHRRGRQSMDDDVPARLEDGGSLQWAASFASPRLLNNSLYLQGYVPELTAFLKAASLGAPAQVGIDDALEAMRAAERLLLLDRWKESAKEPMG